MLIETYLPFITSLGNIVVTAALVVSVATYLAIAGRRNQALALMLVWSIAALGIGVAKLVFMSCHANLLDPAVHSPSGHVAISTAVYCMVTTIVTARMNERQSVLTWICAILLIVLIAVSRVLLGFHTSDEVIMGLLVGGASYGIVRGFFLRKESVQFNGLALAAIGGAVIILFHNVPFPAEQATQWLAMHMRHHVTVC